MWSEPLPLGLTQSNGRKPYPNSDFLKAICFAGTKNTVRVNLRTEMCKDIHRMLNIVLQKNLNQVELCKFLPFCVQQPKCGAD